MDLHDSINFTPCRKLEFFVDLNKEKENLDNCNGENLIIEDRPSIEGEKIPKIGMEFDTEEAAYKFYNEYARIIGFSIRKYTVHKDIKGRIIDRTFCCARQGHRQKDKRDVTFKSHRPETRKGGCAMMRIDGRDSSKYKVVSFIAEHNGHDLVSPSKTYMLRSHRALTIAQALQADDINRSGITPRAGFSLMAKQVGGRENVGFIYEDYKNYLRSKRTVEMKIGDTGGVLVYLQQKQLDDPNFFYAIQVDEDDLIANIIWADAQMMADYAHFGDVVCFDTTYRKNKEGRSFALFVGVNHHKQTIVFGATLLYDETASTFMWLFETFARAMSGKQPKTILTDQDAAMAKALALKWPKTYHRLCIWHIYQIAAIHLSNIFARFASFSKDFSSCIYDYDEEEEFLNAWYEMLEKYGLQTNEWMEGMFKIREKWALVYGRQTFCADLMTTQRSESMNSVLKKYVNYKHNLLQFFHHFDRLIEDRPYQELKADLRTNQSTSVASFSVEILKHAASVYTHEVFELFQDEVRKAYDSRVELCGESGEVFEYKVTPFRKRYQHTVVYHLLEGKVSCSCKKFEFAGILCSHALKVLSLQNVVKIPDLYIKKRWTKKAKRNVVEAQSSQFGVCSTESVNEMEEKKMIGVHYKELHNLTNQFVTRGALTVESFRIAKTGLFKVIEEIEASLENKVVVRPTFGPKSIVQKNLFSKAMAKQVSSSEVCEKQTITLHEYENAPNEIIVKGWKNKENKPKSGKRPRSGLEKSIRRKKQKSKNASSLNNGSNDIGENNQNLNNGTQSLSIGALLESNSSHSLSQFSQEYQVGGYNLSMVHPTQGSSSSHVEPLRHAQILNPIINQQLNFAHYHSREVEQSKMSLTQLLQQQLSKPQGFEKLQFDGFTSQGQYGKANNGML